MLGLRRYHIDGFTLDWEFGAAFDWVRFNATWAYVTAVLAREDPPITVEVCINSAVQNQAWAASGDPSGNTYFRRYPWHAAFVLQYLALILLPVFFFLMRCFRSRVGCCPTQQW